MKTAYKVVLGLILALFVGLVPVQSAHAFSFGDILDPIGIFGGNDNNSNGFPLPLPGINNSFNANIDTGGGFPLPLPLPGFGTSKPTPSNVNNYYSNSNNQNSNIGSTVNSNVNSPNGTVTGVTNNNGTGSNPNINTGNGTPSNYNNTPDYGTLSANCYATPSWVNVNETTSWYLSLSGGNGNYSIDWSGTDGLSGSGRQITRSYSNPGTKNASVRVVSNGQTLNISCSPSLTVNQRYNYNYDNNNYNYNNDYNNNYNYYNTPLYVRCTPNITSATTYQTVTWNAYVTGGSGNYDYSWSGTDGLYSTGGSASRTYSASGSKYASVTVRSNGTSQTASCDRVVYVTAPAPVYQYQPQYPQYPQNPTQDLPITCSANVTSLRGGEPVTWTAVSGLNVPIAVRWTGTDGLTGGGGSLRTTYLKAGTKTASIIATLPNGQTYTRACSNSVYVTSAYKVASTVTRTSAPVRTTSVVKNLDISCMPNTSTANKGDMVVWTSNVSGGNGTYRYIWSGSDGLSGTSNSAYIQYGSNGMKGATVTVSSGSQTVSAQCAAPVVVGGSAISANVAFSTVPWGVVAVIVILVLLITVVYLIFNKNKI